jgi:CheY-like chemotaxis protein
MAHSKKTGFEMEIRKILVVDDNPEFLSMMGDLLRDQGYEVFLAEDGKQAREFLEEEQFDLIISDILMPTLDGTRFHSYVREFTEGHRNVPFIFISGYSDGRTRNVIVDPELDFFLSKPASFEDLLKLIRSLENVEHPKCLS